MTARRRALFLILLITMLVGGSLAVARNRGTAADESAVSLAKVLEVVALLKTEYVDPLEATDLIRAYINTGSINGMLRTALKGDPYTRYLNAQAYRQMQIDTTGEFAGIGLVVGMKDERVTVISVIDNTPAQAAGLRSGDRIVAIDGRLTDLMSLDEAVSLMRGKDGTVVTLEIERGKEAERFSVEITRAVVKVPSVTGTQVLSGAEWSLTMPIGYIRLAQFSERTSAELEEALQKLEHQKVQGLVLDLRNNPGGLLTSAVEVSSKFLPDGPVVHIVGRNRQRQTLTVSPGSAHPSLPLVVLVNEYSASASEIVSGALQDRGVATVVGARTFGKGLVQVVIPMRDGSALSLTSARYQTAGGRFIHEKGIEPDIEVSLSDSEKVRIAESSGPDPADPQLRKALEVLQNMAGDYANGALKLAG